MKIPICALFYHLIDSFDGRVPWSGVTPARPFNP